MTRTCPLCLSERDHLETHHWTYEPERTVELCHMCHIYGLHEGMKAHEQAKENGGDWWTAAVAELVRLHRANRDADEPIRPEALRELYNVPMSAPEIYAAYVDRYAGCRHVYVDGTAHCRDCGKFIGYESETWEDTQA